MDLSRGFVIRKAHHNRMESQKDLIVHFLRKQGVCALIL
ncbi:hypothetical protein A2U01_0099806, partial [Trifolium medium]|nr:hypothetical protein [Trifolium medium]